MDEVLRNLYSPNVKFIICGDFNVDYLTDNTRKSQLNSLLNTYNLFNIVDFPTRIQKSTRSAIDNIFIDYSRLRTSSITPISNGLSDHDPQLVTIHDIALSSTTINYIRKRKIDKSSLVDLNFKLSFEIWSDVFEGNDVNVIFNSFLNTFLRYVYASFPVTSARSSNTRKNMWITSNIKDKCNMKRYLYHISRNSNDPKIRNSFKQYCKSLACLISKTKRSYYDQLIANSDDRIKSTWRIVKTLSGRNSYTDTFPTSNNTTTISDATPCTNSINIAESFNDYFLSLANTIISNRFSNPNIGNSIDNTTTFNEYLSTTQFPIFPTISCSPVSTNEIINITKKLKTTYSYGYDEVPIKILKHSIQYIVSPLVYIINRSLTTGIFHDRLKFAVIIPIYKKATRKI
jgi:hypothetical protein